MPAFVMLAVGLALLVFGADRLIVGARVVASAAGVSSFVVGLTVVAFGTSAPELAAAIGLAMQGHTDAAVGTVVGSNIANVGLILGLVAVFRPIKVHRHIVKRDVAVMVLISFVTAALMWGGRINRLESGLLALGIVIYVVSAYTGGRNKCQEESPPVNGRAVFVGVLFSILGAVVMAGGAKVMVMGAEQLAQALGVPEFVIALTLVAFGTSLPELVTSIRAAFSGESDLAVGNIIGSNVFNMLAVLGITGLVAPLEVPATVPGRDIWFMLGAAVLCLPIMSTGGRITRGEGLFLVIGYLTYVAVVFAS